MKGHGGRVLGLPRGRRGDGPVAVAQVRGDGPRRRGADAIHADPQREAAGARPGIAYTAMCNETGGMLDDGTRLQAWARTTSVGSAATIMAASWLREQAEAQWLAGVGEESPDGPDPQHRSSGAKEPWTCWPRSCGRRRRSPPWPRSTGSSFTIGRIGGFHGIPVMVSRTGYTGELRLRGVVPPVKDAPAMWDAVFAAGEAHDIAAARPGRARRAAGSNQASSSTATEF